MKKEKKEDSYSVKDMRILLDKISVFTWERVTEANVYVQDGLHNFDDDVNIVAVHFGTSLR